MNNDRFNQNSKCFLPLTRQMKTDLSEEVGKENSKKPSYMRSCHEQKKEGENNANTDQKRRFF